MKPQLTIDLVAPEGNAYMLIAASLNHLANELGEQFEQIATNPDTSYQDIRTLAERYCTVTWLNEYARFTEAATHVQDTADELTDTLAALHVDLDRERPINTIQAREQIQELRDALTALEQTLDTLPEKK